MRAALHSNEIRSTTGNLPPETVCKVQGDLKKDLSVMRGGGARYVRHFFLMSLVYADIWRTHDCSAVLTFKLTIKLLRDLYDKLRFCTSYILRENILKYG